ncbi:MAG: HAD family hydrolase [Dehalococcoidia bacterium]|nr:HAD family hydrolase [Dehalococcoidia bacterium]
MIRAVLLDLDGTLVDSMSAWGGAFGDALEVGRPHVPALGHLGDGPRAHLEVFRPLVHRAHRDAGGGEWQREFLQRAFVLLLEQLGSPNPAVAEQMFAHYEAAWPRHVRLYPEVPTVLERLARHYRLAIVSNGLGVEQRLKIEPLGLDRHIEVAAISSELGTRKPEPAIFRHALEQLDVAPGEAIHVGDDIGADVLGARAAGLAAGIWLNRDGGLLQEQPAYSAQVDFELDSLSGLVPLIEQLSQPTAPPRGRTSDS